MRTLFAAVLTLVAVSPLAAQEWLVARERFAFIGTRLTVDVDVHSAGSLRIVRGEPGRIRVAGRSLDGFTSSGLDARSRLVLTAAGDGRVDYLISVPRGVWVSVRLPDRAAIESVGSHTASGSFEWQGTPAATPVASVMPRPDDPYGSLFTTYAADRAPRVLDLPDLAGVRSFTVRIEGHRFRVAAGRPLSVARGDAEIIEIRPTGPPMDLAITVPEGTTRFTLRAEGEPVLTIDGLVATALCLPVTEQRLSEDRRWFTFSPRDGHLQCPDGSRLRLGS